MQHGINYYNFYLTTASTALDLLQPNALNVQIRQKPI